MGRIQSRKPITIILTPNKVDVNQCNSCQDLKTETPIFFNLITDFFGIIGKDHEEEFLLNYHMRGHKMFEQKTKLALEAA